MSDARWHEIDQAVSAVRHFSGAAAIFAKLTKAEDRYIAEMAFFHAMLAGHTLLESALLRILELLQEQAPSGPRWHADLRARTASSFDDRPPILTGEAAAPAAETGRFRSVAAHAYDNFDVSRAARAVASAAVLASLLPYEIARFRQAIDP